MPRKIQPSGAQKRKLSKENNEKTAALLTKTARLTTYFSSSINEKISANENEKISVFPDDSTILPITSEENNLSPDDPLANSNTSRESMLLAETQYLKESFSDSIDRNYANSENKKISDISHVDQLVLPNISEENMNHKIKDNGPVNNNDTSDVCIEISSCDPDPAKWFPVREKHVSFWTKSPIFQNKNDSDTYPESRRIYQAGEGQGKLEGTSRYFKNSMFYSRHDNGERHLRKWLVYSSTKGAVYCFYCTLMSSGRDRFSSEHGFNDWKKGEEKLKTHEQSQGHRDSVLKFNFRCKESSHVDKKLEEQVEEKRKYWTEILRRVVAVTIFLAERGLAFRGSNEIIGSKNNGNFLGIMELIAQFDPFLMGHLKEFGNPGSGKQSYLSSTIYEEIVLLMAKHVQNYIVAELKDAKYFSISVDSTPDLAHVDQLTIIVRYVVSGKPVEIFLTFLQPSSHKANELATALLDFLEKEGINFADCRGQSYDNASNMSGKYTGMQARLKNKNPAADFIPCAAHSLNLVGQTAASCCIEAVNYFGFVQKLYTFFSASTQRWSYLMKSLKNNERPLTLKSLSGTRWSASADATEALVEGYHFIQNALGDIEDDLEQTPEARHEAQILGDKMDDLEMALMAKIWNIILVRFNATSKALQSIEIDLKKVVDLLNSLEKFLASLRDRYEEIEADAKKFCRNKDYKAAMCRSRMRNKRYDINSVSVSEEVVLSPREKFRCGTFNVILDQLSFALKERRVAYQTIYDKFKVIVELSSLSNSDIRNEAQKLITAYPHDLSNVFIDEIIQFSTFAKLRSCVTPSQQAILLNDEGLVETFPSVNVAFRIYLSMMVTNCSGERTFSKLALIKNYLRTTMAHERLSALCLLDAESDILKMMRFEELIKDFAETKSRKQEFI